jgi:hypothetical protein
MVVNSNRSGGRQRRLSAVVALNGGKRVEKGANKQYACVL